MCVYCADDFKNAFKTFKEASKLMPQQSDWYFNMGVVLGQMSLYEVYIQYSII